MSWSHESYKFIKSGISILINQVPFWFLENTSNLQRDSHRPMDSPQGGRPCCWKGSTWRVGSSSPIYHWVYHIFPDSELCWLVVWTPLKNMNVTWDDYSQYMGKNNVPNHQPVPDSEPWVPHLHATKMNKIRLDGRIELLRDDEF